MATGMQVTVTVDGRYSSRLRRDAADRLHSIAGDLLDDARHREEGHGQAQEIPGEVEKVVRIAALLCGLQDDAGSVRITCDGEYLLRELQTGLYREADDLKEISESASLRFEDVQEIVGRLSDLTSLATEVQQQVGGERR